MVVSFLVKFMGSSQTGHRVYKIVTKAILIDCVDPLQRIRLKIAQADCKDCTKDCLALQRLHHRLPPFAGHRLQRLEKIASQEERSSQMRPWCLCWAAGANRRLSWILVIPRPAATTFAVEILQSLQSMWRLRWASFVPRLQRLGNRLLSVCKDWAIDCLE